MRIIKYLSLLIALVLFTQCGSSSSLVDLDEMLELSGRKILPVQDEFPDDGAVYLYENIESEMKLDSDYELNYYREYSASILYFNDKAKNYLTNTIYLPDGRVLKSFSARTIKPNGEIIELTTKDLHPTKVDRGMIEFSDDESVKFTFPAVEPGAILEFTYQTHRMGSFYGDTWYVQNPFPTLYSRYAIKIPELLLQYDYNWNYVPINFDLPKPKEFGASLLNKESRRKRDKTIYWELKNIPALERESNDGAFRDITQYVRFDFLYENWNKLTERYWKRIKTYFNDNNSEIEKLALELTAELETDEQKIEAIYNYVQKEYRYIAVSIGSSGLIPHSFENILKNKYGDCKDMSVMLVLLLKEAGLDAYPALVNTKGRGKTHKQIISLDFNHMIAYVSDSDDKSYWLDATGSSCPINEVYSSLEGVNALVLLEDGKSQFKTIPMSRARDNAVTRTITYNVGDEGIDGHVKINYKGNRNLGIRSSLKDASTKDMEEIITSIVNDDTPDLTVTNITYDDPSKITTEFNFEFDFNKEKFGSSAGKMLIFKPNLFNLDPALDVYPDEERKFPIVYNAPFETNDIIEINFDSDKYDVEALTERIAKSFPFAVFRAFSKKLEKNKLQYKRVYRLNKTEIKPNSYQDFRSVRKAIASANEENIVLKAK